MSVQAALITSSAVVVAVDAGKNVIAVPATDAGRSRLFGPAEFAMTAPALRALTGRLQQVLPAGAVVRVGVEAAGHYHRPLLAGPAWPAGWQVLELNPAHVTEQRRVRGRRGVKTDAVDLEAMTDLLLAGQGVPAGGPDTVVAELAARAAHRARRVHARVAVKNQLLGQLGQCFPALTLVLPDVLGTKAGRLVAAGFADPARLAALGVTRFTRFAAARGLTVRRGLAERLVAAARDALPTAEAAAARRVLAADLALLASLDARVTDADAELARLLPASPYATLTSVPGWGVIRAAAYGAARGDPARHPGPARLCRSAGLSPLQHESAGKRRDGAISREGSVELRRALPGLGIGLRHCDPPARAYAAAMKARGQHGGIIACALARRASRITFALVRDQARYDPARWTTTEDQPPPSQLRPADARLKRRRTGPDAATATADTLACHAVSSLAPGPSPSRQPERRQMTRCHTGRGRIHQRGRPGPPPLSRTQIPAKIPTAPRREAAEHARHPA